VTLPWHHIVESPPNSLRKRINSEVRSTQVEMEQRLFLFNWPIRPGPVVDSPYRNRASIPFERKIAAVARPTSWP